MMLNIAKIKSWYEKEKNIIALSVLSGLIITTAAAAYSKSYSDRIVSNISKEVIRFHVLANSDLSHDQSLKLKVKDAVINEYESMLKTSESLDETREMLSANMEGINNIASEVIASEGYDYPVAVSLSRGKFPTKVYGDITLPAGNYEALRIEIGEAKGQNWWCVMFPPLCYVDAAQSDAEPEIKELLKNNLSEEEYQFVDMDAQEENESIKVKFKIVEWWQEQAEESDDEDIITAQNEGENARIINAAALYGADS